MMTSMASVFLRMRRLLALGLALAGTAGATAAELGIKAGRFTLDGEPVFLLGMSYYGALGAPADFIRRDLDDMVRHGFNWLRVWATWDFFDHDVSALDRHGAGREPHLGRLKWLVAECDRRGMVVDVTLTRGDGKSPTGRLTAMDAHQQAVETLVTALRPQRNWYLDLANEHTMRHAGVFVSTAELKQLRDAAKRLDPQRLVTASTGEITRDELRATLLEARIDFISPHRPRQPASPRQTGARTRECVAWMKDLGHVVPVHYQEPLRRGFVEPWNKSPWKPAAEDFLTDLRQARDSGAAGWCFHNGPQDDAPDRQPRRSFDLRTRRLFEQFDDEERRFLAALPRAAAPVER